MDVPFRQDPRVEIFTARIDVRNDVGVVLFLQQCGGDLVTGGDHASQPTVEIGDDDEVALAGQTGAEVFHLSCEPPTVVQKDQSRIDPFLLWPEEQAVDLMFFRHSGFEVGIHHLVGMSWYGDSARKSSGSRTDLLQCEWCRCGHGGEVFPNEC